jgi:hypothetical protein
MGLIIGLNETVMYFIGLHFPLPFSKPALRLMTWDGFGRRVREPVRKVLVRDCPGLTEARPRRDARPLDLEIINSSVCKLVSIEISRLQIHKPRMANLPSRDRPGAKFLEFARECVDEVLLGPDVAICRVVHE